MGTPPYVPEPLRDAPFRGSTAVRQGLLTPAQLRSSAWHRLFRDVHVRRGLVLDDRARLAALWLVVPPDALVRGRTAAWLWGAWRPRDEQPVPLEVARPRSASRQGLAATTQRRLVTSQATHPFLRDVVELDGLRVLSPHRACFELMRQRALVEAVVVADAFAHCGALRLCDFWAYVQAHPRWPGVRLVRRAADLATSAACSPGESRLRMVVVLGGAPPPLVNVPVYRGEDLVGVPDLLVLGTRRVALEYQGEVHWQRRQGELEDARSNRFARELGMPVLRYGVRAVSAHRHLILRDLEAVAGVTDLLPLDGRHFRPPPAALTW